MNLQTLLFFTVSFLSLPLYPMSAGIVIDPINYNGRFTVATIKPALSSSATAISMIDPLELAKNKGMPVVISLACSALPWWAITTGTGYILIQQFDENSNDLYRSLIAGSCFALAEAVSRMMNDTHYANYVSYALNTLFAAGCISINYLCCSNTLQEGSFSALQAIGSTVLIRIAQNISTLYDQPQTQITPKPFHLLSSEERIQKILNDHPLDGYNLILKPYLVAGGIVFGGLALANPAVYAAAFAYLKNTPLLSQTFISQQAYILGKKGCDACKNIFTKTPEKKQPKD